MATPMPSEGGGLRKGFVGQTIVWVHFCAAGAQIRLHRPPRFRGVHPVALRFHEAEVSMEGPPA
jgi:hypothetical protein